MPLRLGSLCTSAQTLYPMLTPVGITRIQCDWIFKLIFGNGSKEQGLWNQTGLL